MRKIRGKRGGTTGERGEFITMSASATKQAHNALLHCKLAEIWSHSPRRIRIEQLGEPFPFKQLYKTITNLTRSKTSTILQLQCGHLPILLQNKENWIQCMPSLPQCHLKLFTSGNNHPLSLQLPCTCPAKKWAICKNQPPTPQFPQYHVQPQPLPRGWWDVDPEHWLGGRGVWPEAKKKIVT